MKKIINNKIVQIIVIVLVVIIGIIILINGSSKSITSNRYYVEEQVEILYNNKNYNIEFLKNDNRITINIDSNVALELDNNEEIFFFYRVGDALLITTNINYYLISLDTLVITNFEQEMEVNNNTYLLNPLIAEDEIVYDEFIYVEYIASEISCGIYNNKLLYKVEYLGNGKLGDTYLIDENDLIEKPC